ncbi:MAG: methyltransferase domain-containing protein [Candidatus Omnitrophica bacterium]|nr:methyltransferase domain-containing protein [Candidatus Omnitrophota bacterium]
MKDYLSEFLYNYHWDPAKALLRAIEARIISPVELKPPILDMGCGDGTFTSVLLERNSAVGLDYKAANLFLAKRKKVYSGLVVCDARAMSFKNNSFSSLLINSFLEHVPEGGIEEVLSESSRVLKDKAKVVLTINCANFSDQDPVFVFLKKYGLSKLSLTWKRYLSKRLALNSLKDAAFWKRIFAKTNFKILESKYYLSPKVEGTFFLWTDLQYIGISKVNLGSMVRFISNVLSFIGINFHRKIIASVFSRILRDDYVNDSGSGSCLLFVLEKKEVSVIQKNSQEGHSLSDSENGQIRKIVYSMNPDVSVIIPSLDGDRGGNVSKLLADLSRQAYRNFEVLVVKKVSPQGKAINMGVSAAGGDTLVIIDDDSRVDNIYVIENLLRTLKENKDIGMAGASILVPPDANWLQKKAGEEFPRFGMKVVEEVTESDMACHGCCAIPRKVFDEVGGERENILRGLDPDLRFRMRQKGYKTVLAPNTWVYHPLPGSIGKLAKTFFRNGLGSAYCLKYQPQLIYDTDEALELNSFKPKVPFFVRIFRFPLRIVKAIFEFKFLRALAYFVYALGFGYGIVKYSFNKGSSK